MSEKVIDGDCDVGLFFEKKLRSIVHIQQRVYSLLEGDILEQRQRMSCCVPQR